MRTRLLLLAAIVLVAAGSRPAPAQVAGHHDGMFIGFSNLGSTAASAVGTLNANNLLQTYVSQANGPWPHWGHIWGATPDVDNERVLIHALVGLVNPPPGYALVAWDPGRPGIVSTLWSGPFGQGVPQNLTNLTLNSDGNPVSYDTVLGHLVELDRQTGLWSSRRIAVPNNAGLAGFVWDRLRGGYLWANSGSTAASSQVLLRTAPDGVTTTVAWDPNPNYRGAYGGDLLENGDWISGSLWNAQYLMVGAASSVWTTGPNTALRMWDVTAERFSAPGRGYWAGLVTSPQLIAHVDASTTPHAITTLVASTTQAMPSWIMEVLPLHDRDLVTRRTGKATWDLLVNPGGGRFAGRPYVVAASLGGATPAIPLPDGREVFLVPDALTVLSARGPVWPFLVGNTGTLDAAGRATAHLDLRALGLAANGIVVHLAGAVLDASAPAGVGWVLDPWAFVIDVKS
jgi:hypothetical protein